MLILLTIISVSEVLYCMNKEDLKYELYEAIRFGRTVEEIRAWIDKGSDLNYCGHVGTPLTMEVSKSDGACRTEVIRLLLEAGANADKQNRDGAAPLHFAASKQVVNFELLNLLLGYAKQVDIRDVAGRTPLMRSAQYGCTEIAKMLLAHKADINAQDLEGDTPLMYAIEFRQIPMIKLLLENGADISIKNNKGLYAYDCAIRFYHAAFLHHDSTNGLLYRNIANMLYEHYMMLYMPLYEHLKQLFAPELVQLLLAFYFNIPQGHMKRIEL